MHDYEKTKEIDPDIQISVNASSLEMVSDEYFNHIKSFIYETNMPKENLVIELTEGTTISDSQNLITYTKMFNDIGIKIALDDFGTGYNAIASMMDMHLNELKIDRSFIKGYPNHSGALTKSIIKMGEALKLDVITEGVETEIQKDSLIESGCHLMQGYLFQNHYH